MRLGGGPSPPAGPGPAGGQPLASHVAARIGQTLGIDVSPVRVHSASRAAAALGARAVAYGRHVFLGAGERATDLPLMAHEVAHVVQQQGAPNVQLFTRGTGDRYEHEARGAATAVVSGRRFDVTQRTTPRIQRLGISDALDYFADHANAIPGFRMLTIILGANPINMSRVERTPANVIRAVVEFMPGGFLITQALDNYGIIDRVGGWVQEQIATLGMTGAAFRRALDEFLDSLSWRDIFHLGDVWDRAKEIFGRPVRRVIDFLGGLLAGVLRFIKDAILRPLAGVASQTRGWDLLKAVLGQDPITGDPFPRNAETLIGGFMHLIGQDEVWQNIQRARAIPRAWAWFQGALAGLMAFVRQIPSVFLSALQQLEIADLILVPRAFAKVARVFGGFALQFVTWAGQQVISLLQIIFEVVAPGVMPYLRKAAGAFRTIIADPIRFIGYLVRAGIQGFRQFGANFLSHLRNSLIQWLTGTLAGANIYIPQAFEIREIIKFVLSVLGLTWANIRAKLVRLIPEPVVTALETTFDIVVTLVREGPAAAWDKIKEQISNLKEMVMEQVMTFVRDRIVQAAITRLVTSLNPAGAFIQAVIAIYNTIMFFVERLRQIAQVVASFIDSISAIASGAIGAAANRVEQTMAGLLTLVISFLARLVGLGRVSDAIQNVVNRIRAPIDRALDRVVEWIVNTARNLGRLAVRGARAMIGALTGSKSFTGGGEGHRVFISGPAGQQAISVASTQGPLGAQLDALTRQAANLPQADRARAISMIANVRTKLNEWDQVRQQPQSAADQYLDQLAAQLGPIYTLVDPPMPVTAVQFNPLSLNGQLQGMAVAAQPLTRTKGNTDGSGSTSAHIPAEDHMTELNAVTGGIRWVKMHLLHGPRLHGPNDARNFTPAPTGVNTNVYDHIEDPAIKAKDASSILYYQTVVVYRTAEDEEGFPRSVTLTWGLFNPQTGAKQQRDSKSYPVPAPGEGVDAALLNHDGRVRLERIGKLTQRQARAVVEARDNAGGKGSLRRGQLAQQLRNQTSYVNVDELVVAVNRGIFVAGKLVLRR